MFATVPAPIAWTEVAAPPLSSCSIISISIEVAMAERIEKTLKRVNDMRYI